MSETTSLETELKPCHCGRCPKCLEKRAKTRAEKKQKRDAQGKQLTIPGLRTRP